MALATKGKSTQRQSSLNVPNHSFSFHTLLANFYLLFAALSHCVFPLLFDFIVGLLAVGFLVRSSRLILRLGFGFALTGCPATALASSPALQPQLPQRFIKLYNLTPFQLANVGVRSSIYICFGSNYTKFYGCCGDKSHWQPAGVVCSLLWIWIWLWLWHCLCLPVSGCVAAAALAK